MVNIYYIFSKSIGYQILGVNLHVMYDFDFKISCHYSFINSNKRAALVKNVDRIESVLKKNKGCVRKTSSVFAILL